MTNTDFPPLGLSQWRDTRDTLHGYSRLLGKIRAACAPEQKHWWHVTLHAEATGLTTTPIPMGDFVFSLSLDVVTHRLVITTSCGAAWSQALVGQSLATLSDTTLTALAAMGVEPELDPSQFSENRPGTYHKPAVAQYWKAAAQIDGVLKRFKGTLRQETSPVHLFPHHFDLSVNWFSGRLVPGIDPQDEENADEQMNFGFSTGDEAIADPYFYITAHPMPGGFTDATLCAGARWHTEGFSAAIMMYERLVGDDTPRETLFEFFRSTHHAIARLMMDP